eukprot:jgi/Undpi1/3509/HiC_scaffold_16.g06881.m1
MSRRDSAWLVLTVILLGGAYLLWPILFSLKVDGTTSMSWAAVWTPLWVADGIGVVFFLVLVSWGKLRPPPGWEGEWRDPYPVSLRVLALAKWVLLLLFQVLLVCRLDGHINDSWETILSPLIAWVCLRALGGLYRLHLQTKRLFAGKAIAAVKVLGESVLLLLQLLFLIWRLDDEVSWGWWVVFIPAWLLYAGRLFSWCLNKALAFYLAHEIKELENCSEEERKRMIEASLLMDNAKYSRHVFSGSLIMTVLAVFLIAGANFSAFVIFIPQFFSAGWFIIVVSCLICCTRQQQATDLLEDAPGDSEVMADPWA